MNINNYIGIPYHFNEATHDGADCLGLVRLYYKEHNYLPTFYDDYVITKENYNSSETWKHLFKYLNENMDKVEDINELKEGDIVLFSIYGDIHFGIIADEYGRLLAGQIPSIEGETQSTLYRKSWWEKFYRAAYKRK